MIFFKNFFHHRHNYWREIFFLIFRAAFCLFALFFIVDYVFPGFVTNWFNPIWILIIAVISAIISQDNE